MAADRVFPGSPCGKQMSERCMEKLLEELLSRGLSVATLKANIRVVASCK